VVVFSARPGRLLADLAIDLPTRDPAVKDTPEFVQHTAEVRRALAAAQRT
jgi:hypothetical protein